MNHKEIDDCRTQIDLLDGELLRLLNKRAQLASKVDSLKRRAGLPLGDPGREREILVRARENNQGPFDPTSIISIFRRIIRESRRLQQQLRQLEPTDTSVSQRISAETQREFRQ